MSGFVTERAHDAGNIGNDVVPDVGQGFGPEAPPKVLPPHDLRLLDHEPSNAGAASFARDDRAKALRSVGVGNGEPHARDRERSMGGETNSARSVQAEALSHVCYGRDGQYARSAAQRPAIADGHDASLEARHISTSYQSGQQVVEALRDVTAAAGSGEIVSIVGPSGSGKSTLLHILAGLLQPDSGEVVMDGEAVGNPIGRTALMPQRDLLMPWKTVIENVIVGMRLGGVSGREARAEALRLFPRFGLQGFESAYPMALSGGMRQRAALLRTLLTGRDILLLDEPFGALDAITRMEMQSWLLEVQASFNTTMLVVTHDVDEAIYLSDRVYVLSARPGRVVATHAIPFDRPRCYDDTVTSPRFAALKREILQELREGRDP